MGKEQQLLSEYNALRTEIIEVAKNIANLTLVMLTVSFTAMGVAFSTDNPYPALVGVGFSMASLLSIYSRQFTMDRIGSYISIFIEQDLDNLRWESILISSEELYELEKKIPRANLITHTFVLLCSLLTFAYLIYDKLDQKGIFICSVFYFLIAITYIILVSIYKSDKKIKYYEMWKEVKQKISNNAVDTNSE